MPRLTPADATLILDYALGDPGVHALLAALPFPSDPAHCHIQTLFDMHHQDPWPSVHRVQ